MNTGQMLLAVGAIMLLSSMVLRFNRAVLTTDEVMYNSKFNVLASSLCTSLIDEAKQKAFDEATTETAISDLTKLSATMQADGGENYDEFDDFDDFHNYYRVDSTSIPRETFYISSKVTYVNLANPIAATTSKTWHKMITVTVLGPSMKVPVTISSIYSYWFFR